MKTILSLLTMSIFCSTFAQEFSFPIYFEDALGNKDTIVIGYDATATNGIDPQFGEFDILNQPWQGPLDVRIGPATYYYGINPNFNYSAKKKIVPYNCIAWEFPVSIKFYAENLPVKIKFGEQLNYADSCHAYTRISNPEVPSFPCCFSIFYSTDSIAITGIELAGQEWYHEMYNTAYKISSLSSNATYLPILERIEDGKKIGDLLFFFLPRTQLSSKNIHESNFTIAPNPVINELSITTDIEFQQTEIFDLQGKRLILQTNTSKKIDLSSLSRGIYTLKITTPKGEIFKKINKL